MSFVPGENVGPYRILQRLGQGGMATVYKAYHPALDRHVAIKVLHPAFKEDPQFLERFKREARVVARLEHSNIVPIYDFAEHEGQPYLVMKFIEGETLKSCMMRSTIPQEIAIKIVESVGAALAHAHKQGILHRDVKPSNILLSQDGRIYLADYGLARIAEAGASTLSGDMLMGTPQYISPEQASGVKNLDERTDIYSFGIVLYEMAVGRVPFNADTPFSIIHDHIYTPLPLPRDVNPSVSPGMQQVLLKALAKNPKDRYSSADELVNAYLRILVPKTGALATKIGLSAGITGEATKVGAQPLSDEIGTVEKVPKVKKGLKLGFHRRWLWIIAGLTITCISLVMMVAVANRSGIRSLFENSQSEINATQELRQDETSDLIKEAQAAVKERPDDLEARRKLGDAYLGAGMLAEALQEYKHAAGLAFEQDKQLEGVEFLSDMIELQGGPSQAARDGVDNLTEVLYSNVSSEEFQAMYEIVKLKFPNWEAIPILEARRLLLKGTYDNSKQILDKIFEESPDNLLAQSVLAELKFKTGENREALKMVNNLLADSRLPRWLRLYSTNLQQEILNATEK